MKRTSRRPAKRKAAATATKSRGRDEQIRWLLHELQVHSEEITVQNEQLVKAQVEIEHARDRYAELYDFAPMGYLTLDRHGAILECNFAASTLLGRPRRFLLSVPLSALVSNNDRGRLREFLFQSVASDHDRTNEIEITIKTAPPKVVCLVAKGRVTEPGERVLLTAVTDVTVQRQLEEERAHTLVQEQHRARDLAIEVVERANVERRIKTLLERLVTVQEEERTRLSRDLHDQLGQQLTALRLALGKLDQVLTDTTARQYIQTAERIASQLDHDVDHLGWQLRPAALDEFGLIPALETFVREWSDYYRIPVDFSAPTTQDVRLPRDAENHLYRIVQEALNNVAKHAEATHATVQLMQSSRSFRLTVRDKGNGFETSRAAHKAGMGLLGMGERAALAGGEIQIDSTPGRGTTVMVKLPLSPAPKDTPS